MADITTAAAAAAVTKITTSNTNDQYLTIPTIINITTSRVLVYIELIQGGGFLRFEVVVGHQSFEDLLQATVGCIALVHKYKLGWVPVSAEFWPVDTTTTTTTTAAAMNQTVEEAALVEHTSKVDSEAAYRELRTRGPRSYYLDTKIKCSCLTGQAPPQSDELLSFCRALFLKMYIAMPTSWLVLTAVEAEAEAEAEATAAICSINLNE